MAGKQIIMNFTNPPRLDDLEVIAHGIIETLPEELVEFCSEMAVQIEEFPDDAIQSDLDLDEPYELLALYRSGKEMAPGVERKTANDDDILLLFRRPILDVWCENGDDLTGLIREVIIEELGKNFDFSEDEIDEMAQRHYQGMF